ncbi:hypothetical protein [Staphylococcus warneri]|uniref:hypothetical protein n=1 Tax=Staphylococcus warneri TaxID=1292 RepID=UPI0005E02522|nr:hypothetical protein [Staphylococcus warneri]COE64464.1 Uncharacterised protein [Staphylococcus warneri]
MKIYKPIEIPPKDKTDIENFIEELEDIKNDFNKAESVWGIEFLEGTEIAAKKQKIDKDLTDFKQEYEDLQNATVEYDIKEVNEDKIEDANNRIVQLRRRMEQIRNGEV